MSLLLKLTIILTFTGLLIYGCKDGSLWTVKCYGPSGNVLFERTIRSVFPPFISGDPVIQFDDGIRWACENAVVKREIE